VDPEQQVQVRIGLFTLVVLIALGAVVLFLTREGGLFTTTYALHADFDNIQGLTENAPVHLAGNHVGRVRSIYFLGPEADRAIRVELEINSRVRDRIRSDSRAMIQTIGLLGDKYVALTLGSNEKEPLAAGVPVASVEPINFEEVAEEGRRLLGHMTGLARSAETVVGRFENEMGGESLAATLGALQRFVDEIERGDGLLHSIVYEDAGAGALEELEASLAHIRSILREVEEGEGTLHHLVWAPPGEVSTLEALADSTRRLDQILRKIDEGEGTLGALVNDPAVYEDLRMLVGGARQNALLRTLIDYVRPEAGN
jgi:phospholipid/cholesterol/gamma-HCH transport system substrate-binding protein